MTIRGNKIFFEFDPFQLIGKEPPKSGKREAKREIAQYILDSVLDHVGEGKSPVAGESWKKTLNKEYKKRKSEFSSATFANMELEGDMLDSLECVINSRGNLELRISGSEAPKADGHNNHSGLSKLPQRRFIPEEGQTFKRDILSGMKEIAMEFIDDGES